MMGLASINMITIWCCLHEYNNCGIKQEVLVDDIDIDTIDIYTTNVIIKKYTAPLKLKFMLEVDLSQKYIVRRI